MLVTGRTVPKVSPWACPTASQSPMSVTYTRPDHVLQRRPRLLLGPFDVRERPPGLLVGVPRDRPVLVRGRRPRDEHPVADADRPRVPDRRFTLSPRGDTLSLHTVASSRGKVAFPAAPTRTEALNPRGAEAWRMSDATKVVLGTVGVAALLVIAIVLTLAL